MHPKAKNYLILLLALTTISSGFIAWRQNRSLAALQDELIKHSLTSHSDKPKRVNIAETLSNTESAISEASTYSSSPVENAAKAERESNAQAKQAEYAALMSNPEYIKALSLKRRLDLDKSYAELFQKLKLSPADLEKLKTFLVEHQSVRGDVMLAARELGLDPRKNGKDIKALMENAHAEVNKSIRDGLGEVVYNEYQKYEETEPQRDLITDELIPRLVSATPLNNNQREFLIEALTLPPDPHNPNLNRNTDILTDAIIAKATSVLTPDQMTALKAEYERQKAVQLMREMRAAAAASPAKTKTNAAAKK